MDSRASDEERIRCASNALCTDWLARLSDPAFRQLYRDQPYSEPESARMLRGLLTWDSFLKHLLGSAEEELIVSKGGAPVSALPSDAEQVRALFEKGCSYCVRDLHRRDRALSLFAREIERALQGTVAVHAFATPIGHSGFGWHYDCEEVFIVQTAGSKEYYLRKNTVNPEPTIDAMPRDMQFEREDQKAPVIACTLVAGDWLYIPRGWWHTTRGLDDSLSISVGVLTAEAAGGSRRPRREPDSSV